MEFMQLKQAIRKAIDNDDVKELEGLYKSYDEFFAVCSPVDTWLHIAAQNGKLNCVIFLAGIIDIDAEDKVMGVSALTVAALKGFYEVVDVLIKLGAKIDESESHKNPLFAAVSANSASKLETVKILVEAGADVTKIYNTKNYGVVSVLEFAEIWGEISIIDYIKQIIE